MSWINPLIELPSDAAIVWIRVGTNYGNPVLAEYVDSSQTFICNDSLLVVPAYIVARWKPQ